MAECVFGPCSANVEHVIEQETAGDDEGILLRVALHEIVAEDASGPCPGSLMHSPPTSAEADHLRAALDMMGRIIATNRAARLAAEEAARVNPPEPPRPHSKTPHPTEDRGWFHSVTAPRPPLGYVGRPEPEAVTEDEAQRRRERMRLVPPAEEPARRRRCQDKSCPVAPYGRHDHTIRTGASAMDAARDQLRALTTLAIEGATNTEGGALLVMNRVSIVDAALEELKRRAESAATVARAAIGSSAPPQAAREMVANAEAANAAVADVETALALLRRAVDKVRSRAAAAQVSGRQYLPQI